MYINKVLAKFYLDKTHLINISIKKIAPFQPKPNRETFISKKEQYQKMTGLLMFSMVDTRPKITFTISTASYYAKNLSHWQIEGVKRKLKYIKRSKYCQTI